MKKLLFLSVVLMQCFSAFSQEAESSGSTAGLTIIPHFEMNPSISNGASDFSFGNSSLFTVFEGSASEHFSWTLVNNWLTVWDNELEIPFGWQYKNLGRSDEYNFLLYCKVDLTFGAWNITLGKDCISLGGIEYDDWDWDIPSNFASPLWNSISSYQWGGKVAWTTPSEMSTFSIQMTSSPFGERPFSSGLWSYSAQWCGEYGWFSNIWSASAIGYEKGKYDWLFCLGQRASFDRWTISLDYNNSVGAGLDFENPDVEESSIYHLIKGTTLLGTVCWSPLEWFDVSLKGMWTTGGWYAGFLADFYPIKESRDLRIHAGFTQDNIYGEPLSTFNVGVRYNLNIHLW